ncbi:hypothetical protein L1987_75162 [Smallanthus sonchifolius]|uniref:Uncharacterized protein n=1 Tax=Smallanthus sonchifolius TaxID=185202 RepID=A0ACB9A567_9ASTR|nr:hypothetical protein L1987_75162 [Smallanthus sonchifolius]
MNDKVDKLVIFLAKRDGIDKLVKTFQYVSKLLVWHLETTNPIVAHRAKHCEVASGLSRKAFRTGTLDANLAKRMRFISAFGESLGYVFFCVIEFKMIKEGIEEERRLMSLASGSKRLKWAGLCMGRMVQKMAILN